MKTKYDESLREQRQKILSRVLDFVPHDGWTEKSLLKGIQDSGIEKEELYRIFPSGVSIKLMIVIKNKKKLIKKCLWHWKK